jgi:hypothetical protein
MLYGAGFELLSVKLKVNEKVLAFIQSGPPCLTVPIDAPFSAVNIPPDCYPEEITVAIIGDFYEVLIVPTYTNL